MALSVTSIRNAKPKGKPYKLADERGLFLLVQPSGGMLWRFKYRIDGRDEAGAPKRVEKKLGLGTYPDVSLKDARDRRDEARALLAKGIDPADQKRRDKLAAQTSAANTFRAIAKAYIEKNTRDGLAEATVRKSAIRVWGLVSGENVATATSSALQEIVVMAPNRGGRPRLANCFGMRDGVKD